MTSFNTAALAIFLVVLGWDNVSGQIETRMLKPHSASMGVAHGAVWGATQCGGPAKFVELRIQGCEPSSPCKPKVPGNLMSDIDFIPSIDLNSIYINITMGYNDRPAELRWLLTVGGEAKKGVKQTITILSTGERYFAGLKIKEVIEILSYQDRSLQLCVECEYEYVSDD